MLEKEKEKKRRAANDVSAQMDNKYRTLTQARPVRTIFFSFFIYLFVVASTHFRFESSLLSRATQTTQFFFFNENEIVFRGATV